MASTDITGAGAPGDPHGLAQTQLGHTPAHGHWSPLQLSSAQPPVLASAFFQKEPCIK